MNEKFYVLKQKPKLRGEDNHKNVSVRMPDRIYYKLEDIVAKTGWNRSQLMIMALEYALDRLEIEEPDDDNA